MRYIYIFSQKYFDLQEAEVDEIMNPHGVSRSSKIIHINEFRELYQQTKQHKIFNWFDKLLAPGKGLPLFHSQI